MFKHKIRNGDEDQSDEESDGDDDSINVDVEEIKPVSEKLEKLSVNLKKHFGPLKCDKCEFEARNKNRFTMHKRAKHTAK